MEILPHAPLYQYFYIKFFFSSCSLLYNGIFGSCYVQELFAEYVIEILVAI